MQPGVLLFQNHLHWMQQTCPSTAALQGKQEASETRHQHRLFRPLFKHILQWQPLLAALVLWCCHVSVSESAAMILTVPSPSVLARHPRGPEPPAPGDGSTMLLRCWHYWARARSCPAQGCSWPPLSPGTVMEAQWAKDPEISK